MVIRETKKEDLKQVMEIIRMAQKLFKESGSISGRMAIQTKKSFWEISGRDRATWQKKRGD